MISRDDGRRIAKLCRIDDEYGYCLECGEEISDKPLEIDPSATDCIACAK